MKGLLIEWIMKGVVWGDVLTEKKRYVLGWGFVIGFVLGAWLL